MIFSFFVQHMRAKMEEIKILVACHKPGLVKKDNIYTPIHVGRSVSKFKEEMSDMIGDDTGNNISEKNPLYCEMTAQYWAWKNCQNVKFIGFCHYRRYFDTSIFGGLKDKDVALVKCVFVERISSRILRAVTPEDFTIFLMVLKQLYPDYEKVAIDYLWGNKMYAYNMLVCRKELFDNYAKWIFKILFECEKYILLSPYSRGRRVYAYLGEFFMPLYFIYHQCNIKEVRCIGYHARNLNRILYFGSNILKTILFRFSCLMMKKPRKLEDYFSSSVVNGLEIDRLIKNIDNVRR